MGPSLKIGMRRVCRNSELTFLILLIANSILYERDCSALKICSAYVVVVLRFVKIVALEIVTLLTLLLFCRT